jgi:hypothetical protein
MAYIYSFIAVRILIDSNFGDNRGHVMNFQLRAALCAAAH